MRGSRIGSQFDPVVDEVQRDLRQFIESPFQQSFPDNLPMHSTTMKRLKTILLTLPGNVDN